MLQKINVNKSKKKKKKYPLFNLTLKSIIFLKKKKKKDS